MRLQKNSYGLDLSANLDSVILINYFSLKPLFLFYPYPEKKNQFYLGIGPGFGYQLSALPTGLPNRSASKAQGCLSSEGLIGYEFRHHSHFKTLFK